jgi:mono/diheme cytochrome c family protein
MPRWLRRTLVVFAVLVAVLAVAVAGTMAYATHLISKRWDVPAPPVRAATDPVLLARGERFFRSTCFHCHADRAGGVSGKHMEDVPEFLGTVHTANITAHPEAGIGRWSDDDLARAIRFGVRPDGRSIQIMGAFKGISDEDVSAIIGFMRSGDPMFAPVDVKRPAPAPTLVGKVILGVVVGFDPTGKVEGVTAPPPGPTAEYGRYLSVNVLECWSCHTAGFSPSKLHGKDVYAGGFELQTPDGQPILTPNITPDPETGIGRWSRDQFVRAVRDGVHPDGKPIRPPMPTYRALTDDELIAVWAHLRTVPAVHSAVPRAPHPEVQGDAPPALFVKHGCVQCHGEGRPFRAKLRAAVVHDVDEVAARILRPQEFTKGSMMPSYEGRLDERTAKALAAWVKEEAKDIPESGRK